MFHYLIFEELYKEKKLEHGVEKFERLRENFVAYTMIAEKFVQCVVGVNIFKKNCCVKNFSEYISVSDEAMTMLILANNWDVWSEIARYEIATNPKNLSGMKKRRWKSVCLPNVSTLMVKDEVSHGAQMVNYTTTIVISKFVMIEN